MTHTPIRESKDGQTGAAQGDAGEKGSRWEGKQTTRAEWQCSFRKAPAEEHFASAVAGGSLPQRSSAMQGGCSENQHMRCGRATNVCFRQTALLQAGPIMHPRNAVWLHPQSVYVW